VEDCCAKTARGVEGRSVRRYCAGRCGAGRCLLRRHVASEAAWGEGAGRGVKGRLEGGDRKLEGRREEGGRLLSEGVAGFREGSRDL
jgi:hypothetical protein